MTRRRSPTSRKSRKPIRIKAKNVGKMRRTAGAKKGQKVKLTTLRRLAKSPNPTTRKRAVFAINAKTKFKGGSR